MKAKIEWRERTYKPNESGVVQCASDMFVNGSRSAFIQWIKDTGRVTFIAMPGEQEGCNTCIDVAGVPITMGQVHSEDDNNLQVDALKKKFVKDFTAALKDVDSEHASVARMPNIRFSPLFDVDWKPNYEEISVPSLILATGVLRAVMENGELRQLRGNVEGVEPASDSTH